MLTNTNTKTVFGGYLPNRIVARQSGGKNREQEMSSMILQSSTSQYKKTMQMFVEDDN